MLYQTKNGKYRVEVGADGAIKVKPGDWLSKYSAAIHGNYHTINVFVRKGRAGRLERIANPNLIFAGETLYHLPALRETTIDFSVPLEIHVLTESEKKKLTIEHLKKEFNLKGDWQIPYIGKLLDIIVGSPAMGWPAVADGVAALEIFGVIGTTGAAATAATVLSIAGLVMIPIQGSITVVNCYDTGLRHYGARAIAYATTAWAFDEPTPGPPSSIKADVTPAMVQKAIQADPSNKSLYERQLYESERQLDKFKKAWNDAAQSTVTNLDNEVVKRKTTKASYQALLRAAGDNDRQTLAMNLMKELQTQLDLSYSERAAYWTPSPRYSDR